jgi:hypothetical protein
MKPTTPRAGARASSLNRVPALPPSFDGYPYLVTRIGHCPLRHMAVLPADWPRERLLDLACRQAAINRLDTCLCLGSDDAIYVTPEGEVSRASFVPFGSPVVGRLVLADSFPDTPDLAARRAALARFAAVQRGSGYLVGDGLEGGELATDADIARLSGNGPDGFPPGLTRCPECGRLRGDFLALNGEGNGDKTPRVIRVHCLCENGNRCAGCGGALADWRLSSYFWDEAERKVWYEAAYAALSHHCR